MLTQKQIDAREGMLTASRVNVLMEGDEAAVLNLWKEMVGRPFEAEDLTWKWAVQRGINSEPLNLRWFAHKFGPVSQQGEVRVGAAPHAPDWAACTLDGWSDQFGCPIECKDVGGRETPQTVLARYQPQMHWQMLVTGADRCALSVIAGGNEPVVDFILRDDGYMGELLLRATGFMQHVFALTPPSIEAPVAPPIVPVRDYDMSDNPEWRKHVAQWLQVHGAAETEKRCEKAIKGLVPADAQRAWGHGAVVTRNRAGAMSLREGKI